MDNLHPNLQNNNQTVVVGSVFFRHLRTTLYIGSTVLVPSYINNDVKTCVLRAGKITSFKHIDDNNYIVNIILYIPFTSSVVSQFERCCR